MPVDPESLPRCPFCNFPALYEDRPDGAVATCSAPEYHCSMNAWMPIGQWVGRAAKGEAQPVAALSAPESMRAAAAKLVEDMQEGHSTASHGRMVEPRHPGNLAGLGYAAAIRALPVPAQAGEGWNRDMSMAPKDGTEILLYGFGRHRNSPHYRYGNGHHVGWWSDGAWMTRDPDTDCEPHAWQPLPAAPVSLKGK